MATATVRRAGTKVASGTRAEHKNLHLQPVLHRVSHLREQFPRRQECYSTEENDIQALEQHLFCLYFT